MQVEFKKVNMTNTMFLLIKVHLNVHHFKVSVSVMNEKVNISTLYLVFFVGPARNGLEMRNSPGLFDSTHQKP